VPVDEGERVMLEKVFEVIPVPVLLFAAIYAGVAWFLAPGVAERKHLEAHLAACEADARAAEAQARRLPADKEAAIAALEEMLKIYEQLPGGKAVSEGMRKRLAVARTPAAPAINAGYCRCLVAQTARDATVRIDFALWLGSLKFIEESGVSNFAGHMARKEREGVCGKAVL
jgi:hypothetical protein